MTKSQITFFKEVMEKCEARFGLFYGYLFFDLQFIDFVILLF
jgi:hypothetical protein